MNLTEKIIITDTNIITDLNNAKILDKYVKLDNVYISDMVLNDEVNCKTGDVDMIKRFKVVPATCQQLVEINKLSIIEKQLSPYDLINYVIARDNNYILATGDSALKKYAEQNGVEVIRTLRIIRWMNDEKIISIRDSIEACNLLLNCDSTRIPFDSIKKMIEELEEKLVTV